MDASEFLDRVQRASFKDLRDEALGRASGLADDRLPAVRRFLIRVLEGCADQEARRYAAEQLAELPL
jgi:hypothetical protein